jgi:alkylation response protein AidB-like acyl-CoA dehydrogenase
MSTATDADRVAAVAQQIVADHDPKSLPPNEFLGACYDAGLSWVHFAEGFGGLGLSRSLQTVVNEILQGAGGPNLLGVRPMEYGMAAPTVYEHAQTDEVKRKLLRPIATMEDTWCQLFSEPGAGSDLAGLATSAVRDGSGAGADWIVNGQKVWTSNAHLARWGMLVARTNPDVPKHKGLTYFVVDMHGAGVDVRPLRQMTGYAEFNEVYLTDVRIPDSYRLGAVGDGWRVAMTTLMNERTTIGSYSSTRRRGSGNIADAVSLWASRPDLHTPVMRDRLTQLWLRAEAQRLTSERARVSGTASAPGPDSSIAKLVAAELNQHIYQWCMDLLGPEGIFYPSYDMNHGAGDRGEARGPLQQRFLRSRANTIEGGTSEVQRNILGERVLGLPGDLRADAGIPWKDIPRG